MSSTGIFGSGLDVQSIVSQLMYVEQAPLRRLQSERSNLVIQKAAFDTAASTLQSAYDAIDALRTASGFGAKSATSNNTQLVTASATSSASTGTYDLVVSNLATTSSWVTGSSYSSTSQALSGSPQDFTIAVGDNAPVTITFDASNNSLDGLKNAINRSDAGVSASIIHDASGYRLLLASKTSGTDGEISIAGAPADFSLVSKVTAEDAAFTLNGVDFTSSSNTVSDAVEGLTLNLLNESTSHVSITVSDDTASVETAIGNFVEKFNTLMTYLNSQFTYNADQDLNSPLAGNSDLRRIQDELLTTVSESVPGLDQDLRNLRQIGIEMNNDGTLTVDSETLDEALSSNFTQVQRLFQAFGSTSDNQLEYLTASSATVAGTYDVTITQAATQAVDRSGILGTGTLIDPASPETLSIALNGGSAHTVQVSGSLSEIVAAINADALANNLEYRALDEITGGNHALKLYSLGFGSLQSLQVEELDGTVFGFSNTTRTGLDVKGIFGSGSEVQGVGQDLTAPAGEGSEGLQIRYTGTTGGDFTASFSRGYAELISQKLDYFTDTVNGPIILAKNSLSDQMKDIDNQMLNLENQLQIRQEMLIAEYSQADLALRNMSTALSSLNNLKSLLS